jgi:creatinine amidohydrolase
MNRAAMVLATALAMLAPASARSASPSPPAPIFLEQMTTVELKARLAACPVGLIFNGGVEETGPHVALGKHNLRAHAYAERIARTLGNAIVAPILPVAPTAPALDAFPGTLSLSEETFGAVNEQVARSLIRGGFRRVALLGDHGGGQAGLKAVAEKLDAEFAPRGIRILFVGDSYAAARGRIEAWIKAQGKVPGGHGGLWDTSETMAVDAAFVRPDRFRPGTLDNDGNGPIDANGISGDPRGSTAALGRRFADIRVTLAVDQINAGFGDVKACPTP